MKHSLSILLAAAMIVACKPQENAVAQQLGVASTPVKVELLVQLETGGCRGYCPVYKLSFRKDGVLDYTGTRNVEKVGSFAVRLSAAEYSQLLKAVNRVDLWQYPMDIPSTAADAPVHIYTVFDGEKSHLVKGTTGIPQPILDLENLMQDIAEAHGYPVKNGIDPKNPDHLKGRVVVKFKMEVNAKVFCNQFSDLKVHPLSHLGEDNTWLIGFNPSELTETQFISMMKDMEGVLTVEPNPQAKGPK